MTDWLDALESELPRAVEESERSVDPARVERAADAAMRAYSVKPARQVWRTKRTWMLLAAAILIAGIAAAALEVRHLRAVQPTAPTPVPTLTTIDPPATAPMTTAAAAISIEDLPMASASTPIASPKIAETPAQLFARANRSRQDGNVDEAAKLYGQLEDEFPTTNEAAVAHISLGRILESQGNAAGALAEFDRYLSDPSRTDLREDALVGRARACNKLGRTDDEKRAWEALLREYPDSMSAPRARSRVEALR